MSESAPADKSPKKPIEKTADPEDKIFVLPNEN
jgi:hypothetical protein